MPPTFYSRLIYLDSIDARFTSGSLNYGSFDIRLNSLYDPDPLLSTGSLSGVTGFGEFYRRYRVLKVDIHWTIINSSDEPITCFFVAGSAIPPASTRLLTIDLSEDPTSSPLVTLSSAGGMNRGTIRKSYELSQLLGNALMYEAESIYDGFLGGAPTNPNTIISAKFCAFGPSASSTISSIYSVLKITMHTRFYDRQTPND
jgi:hypothetical protein